MQSAIFKFWIAKIHQQPDLDTSCPEIINKLRLMLRQQCSDSLQLYNYSFFNDDVGQEVSNYLPAKSHIQWNLRFRMNPLLL